MALVSKQSPLFFCCLRQWKKEGGSRGEKGREAEIHLPHRAITVRAMQISCVLAPLGQGVRAPLSYDTIDKKPKAQPSGYVRGGVSRLGEPQNEGRKEQNIASTLAHIGLSPEVCVKTANVHDTSWDGAGRQTRLLFPEVATLTHCTFPWNFRRKGGKNVNMYSKLASNFGSDRRRITAGNHREIETMWGQDGEQLYYPARLLAAHTGLTDPVHLCNRSFTGCLTHVGFRRTFPHFALNGRH